jgi:hypothetical protein
MKSANTSAWQLINRTAICDGLRIPASRCPTKRYENETVYTDYAPPLSAQSVGREGMLRGG